MAGEVTRARKADRKGVHARTRAEDRAAVDALVALPPPTPGRPLLETDVDHQSIPLTEKFSAITATPMQPEPIGAPSRPGEHTRRRRQVLFRFFWPDTTH
ncbi:uncharacterized protein EKO05_0003078 [Ascochyta rabiei]|uniref:uncharacterized protein n=1 Tax=Didymella rabiei TaxID=5454 RepID=UPI0021F9C02D|nr:uncharacterized protein EKO05_0003078 [Ascochyta rabiei]UPX12533.1 hypothetical protein EKO05_0003078 [Ascochyta rabiei]